MNLSPATIEFDPGSWKDPEGRVFFAGGKVYRTLSDGAAARMKELAGAGVLERFAADGMLIPTRVADASAEGLDPGAAGSTVLCHERIPRVTYPFEWPFEMLRDAALLTLDMLERCLEQNLTLKDATAYNVAFHRGKVVFFDTLSIDRYAPNSPWEGYSQFCREFLFPLMLTSLRKVEFHAWYRGALDGIAVSDFARIMRWNDWLKPGVLRHVVLQAKLERSFANRDVKVRENFDRSTFSRELIVANIRGLRKLIQGLAYDSAGSEWIDYTAANNYSDEALQQKADVVGRWLKKLAPRSVVDLGCNTGDFTMIAAAGSEQVTAIDIDAACVDALYRRIKAGNVANVVPMVGNLLNPTPGLGWNLSQRRPLAERIHSDAFLALALIHHLRIGGNVPLSQCLDQFRSIAPAGIIEWVGRDDSMVRRMLRNRADVFDDYHWERFEALVRERFTLADVADSHGGARRLCLLLPRN